jgi:TonB family protein
VLVTPAPPPPAQAETHQPEPTEPVAKTKPPTAEESPKPVVPARPAATAPPVEAVAKSDAGETEPPAREALPVARAHNPKSQPDMTLPTTVPSRPKVPEPRESVVRAPAPEFPPQLDPQENEQAPRPPERPQVAVLVPVTPAPPRPAMPAPRGPSGEEPGSSERAAGDPLPPSDSDSDAFSQLNGSALLRQGRLEVQFGRKVKSRRPKFNTGGVVDLIYDQHGVDVVLSVATDATGKVTSVKVAKSSGSNAIDQPIIVSMYDWWFEPPKDQDGKPRPDHFKFTIGLR